MTKYALTNIDPSTDGNVLTSDGTNWISEAPAGGGGASTPQFTYNFVVNGMEAVTAGMVRGDTGSGGSVAWANTYGMRIGTGSASNGEAGILPYNTVNSNATVFNVYDRNPQVHMMVGVSGASYASAFFGIDGDYYTYDPTTYKSMGFQVDIVAGVETIYAYNTDGTAGTKTDVTTACEATDGFGWNTTYQNLYSIIMTSGTDIKFYCNGTLVATHTTNLPSGGLTYVSTQYLWRCGIKGTASNASNNWVTVREANIKLDIV